MGFQARVEASGFPAGATRWEAGHANTALERHAPYSTTG
ncbi:MAG: hypothetical protein ACI9TH_002727 [Kiritimatiellia bacterium]|jgi:hypothetical protein